MEKKKTFKELFAGTGIEPTTDENGDVHYEFNATLTTQSKPQSLFAYVSTSQPGTIVNISTEYQNLSEKEKSELLSKLFEWIANKKAEIKPAKLYTEQQIIMAMHLTNRYKENYNQVLEQLTSIELPSDEEIENIMISKYPHSVGVGVNHLIKSDERIGFEAGAKWMREQILNQNK